MQLYVHYLNNVATLFLCGSCSVILKIHVKNSD